jgi:hypothetical protein
MFGKVQTAQKEKEIRGTSRIEGNSSIFFAEGKPSQNAAASPGMSVADVCVKLMQLSNLLLAFQTRGATANAQQETQAAAKTMKCGA